MFIVLILLLAGIGIGRLLHRKSRVISLFDKFTMYAIWLLLFLMGIGIGKNPEIMQNLSTLGVQALVITLFALGGSILLSIIVYRFFFRKHES